MCGIVGYVGSKSALDFLLEQGLIHKLERLSAFVGCIAHDEHAHAAQFLICRSCGSVDETISAEIERSLDHTLAQAGFKPASRIVDEGPVQRALAKIGEVAEQLDLPQHVLRFWETRFSQIKPMKRAGGRRYYRPADVELLKGIRSLLYKDGYTIRGVQKILREDGVQYVCGVGRGEITPRKHEGDAEAPAQRSGGPLAG